MACCPKASLGWLSAFDLRGIKYQRDPVSSVHFAHSRILTNSALKHYLAMFSKILLLALPVHLSLAVANPLQVTVSVDEWEGIRMPEGPTQPGWKVENDHFIVPLSDQSRRGLVDPIVEEGVITIGTAI